MRDEECVVAIEQALQSDPGIRARARPLWVAVDDGELMLDGEVEDIASKRRAIARASTMADARRVLDRIRVAPAEPMEDGALRDHVRDELAGEQAFDDCSIVIAHDHSETVRDVPSGRGAIRVRVEQGTVSLEGRVPSLVHKRVAETLVWWIPGTRDVRNDLAVLPPEEDSDDELCDAIRIGLEKEPLLDAAQLRIDAHEGEVTLHGVLRSDEQRVVAEEDAWCVPGVREVRNLIQVSDTAS